MRRQALSEAPDGIRLLLQHCQAHLDGTAFFVPGRIEVLGKHTDYAGGRSLLAASEQGIAVVSRPREDGLVSITDAVSGDSCQFPFDPNLDPAPGHWTNYPMTVARRVARNLPWASQGADIVFASNLPPAAGMSSSSALVIASFLAITAASDLTADPWLATPERLAEYLAAVESGAQHGPHAGDAGVGTRGGSEDHTATLCAAPDALVQYSFSPTTREGELPFPPGFAIVVAASGVPAEKTGAAREHYNRAADSARRIAALWRQATGRPEGTLGAIIAAGAADELRSVVQTAETAPFTPAELLERLAQFEAESTRIIPQAAAALASADLVRFGSLVDESQALAERALHNQVPETIHLARSARPLGATAASAFGAGFGGSVWAMVADADAASFAEAWESDYRSRFPERNPTFLLTRPAGSARHLR